MSCYVRYYNLKLLCVCVACCLKKGASLKDPSCENILCPNSKPVGVGAIDPAIYGG